MKTLATIFTLCLLTYPISCEKPEATASIKTTDVASGRSYRSSYGGGSYDGGYGGYGGYGHGQYYEQPYPNKKLYLDLGLPLVVGGLGLGLGVGALKGLILGAILGKKKHHLLHTGYGEGNTGTYGGYGGYSGYGFNLNKGNMYYK